jgi:hypothetical protein
MKPMKEEQKAPVVSGGVRPISGVDGSGPKGVEVLVPGSLLRTSFGVVLFVVWGIATILWVWTDVYLSVHGHLIVAVTSIAALALMSLLGGMEGLEVSVIDRWQSVWPGSAEGDLAGWLAARQLFVALIVTAATLLAQRAAIYIPFTPAAIRGVLASGVFDIAWTTLTVLWFAQILPKHLGAINPDRYLYRLRPVLFPIVAVVHKIGISLPGEWTARRVEYVLRWPASPEELENGPKEPPRSVWAELRRHHHGPRP